MAVRDGAGVGGHTVIEDRCTGAGGSRGSGAIGRPWWSSRASPGRPGTDRLLEIWPSFWPGSPVHQAIYLLAFVKRQGPHRGGREWPGLDPAWTRSRSRPSGPRDVPGQSRAACRRRTAHRSSVGDPSRWVRLTAIPGTALRGVGRIEDALRLIEANWTAAEAGRAVRPRLRPVRPGRAVLRPRRLRRHGALPARLLGARRGAGPGR
jgi:hypothetical protein